MKCPEARRRRHIAAQIEQRAQPLRPLTPMATGQPPVQQQMTGSCRNWENQVPLHSANDCLRRCH
jgi:hypothetical protein